ncbi:RecX family transcriptional regulator [Paenibacillus sp. YN15]|uniref:RecX family transcriptional regulator n=1 Tax=Paenibacillus sp. YN15 TaxID=1742774 RepID=UPI000DCB2C2F|nr:RecX family transcriptional regulator [Paenibacillus sp. YN15]RAV03596.1 RecX family transcriptional regulator [Paenibacillus sp. YN15]
MSNGEAAAGWITSVERQKGNKKRYNLFIDGVYAFSVHEDIMIRHRLLKGEAVDAASIAGIVMDDERHQAYLEAIRYIGRRPRSQQEVRLHLKEKEYEPERINEVVERLSGEGYLNDEAFAKLWTENRIRSQKKGRKWVEMELSQKGVDDADISSALGSIDPEEEYAAALDSAVKKWRLTGGEPFERKQKAMTYLLRRGYSHELVKRVVREVSDQAPDEDADF